MVTESQLIEQRYLKRWALATFGGWLLGIVAMILLDEIADVMQHRGNQFAVGLGMGWGVGFAQWRVAREWFGATSNWMWISTVAMGMPFLLTDVGALSWAGSERSLLFLNVALGASLLGLLEWRILRSRSRRAHWWISQLLILSVGRCLPWEFPLRLACYVRSGTCFNIQHGSHRMRRCGARNCDRGYVGMDATISTVSALTSCSHLRNQPSAFRRAYSLPLIWLHVGAAELRYVRWRKKMKISNKG